MQFLGAVQEAKTLAKLSVQRYGVIPHNVKAAAFCGSFRSERTHNQVTLWLYCVQDLYNICDTLFRFRKKVKYRAIMP